MLCLNSQTPTICLCGDNCRNKGETCGPTNLKDITLKYKYNKEQVPDRCSREDECWGYQGQCRVACNIIKAAMLSAGDILLSLSHYAKRAVATLFICELITCNLY